MSGLEEKFDAYGLSYSREGFKEWLESLPPDIPFCGENNCPISAYFVKQGAPRGLLTLAADADTGLVCRIDSFAKSAMDEWDNCTPREILLLIAEQEYWEKDIGLK